MVLESAALFFAVGCSRELRPSASGPSLRSGGQGTNG